MVEERVEVRKLKSYLVGLEMELSMLEENIVSTKNTISYLRKMEEDLSSNIKFLKKEKVISIASEYRKSIEELKIIKKNLSQYQSATINMSEEYGRKRREYDENYEKYKSLEHYIENRRVILLFDPKKRKKKIKDER